MTAGTGTYKGLAVPLFGDFEMKQGTAGTDHMTLTSVANNTASNIQTIHQTATSAITSGYLQGSYVDLKLGGGITGGLGTQASAFATDITLSGTITGWVTGLYVYVCEGTAAVPTDPAQMDGVMVFFDSLGGGAFTYRAGFHAASQEAAGYIASGLDAAFVCESSGAAGTWGAFLGYLGITAPEYFLTTSTSVTEGRMICSHSPSSTASLALRCMINGSVYKIGLIADSCS